MIHKRLSLVIGATMTALVLPALAQEIEIEVTATQPEYMAQDRGIWDLYEEENPSVKIKLISINEDTEAAYQTRVAAGDPADIRSNVTFIDQDNYSVYADLRDLECANWDLFSYDAKNSFEDTHGIAVQPAINVRNNPYRSFVYYEDVMADLGIDPKSVKTLDDLEALLAQLKQVVDTNDDYNYVLDVGWLAGAWGRFNSEVWSVGFGATKEEIRDLYLGRIAWTDEENNPYVPFYKKLKEWYQKGYMPERWWARNWEQEFEASFISGKSLMVYHGPWIFSKVLAQRPDAQLNGFTWPVNKEGKTWGPEVTSNYGSGIYKVNADKPNAEEVKKALCWWISPEVVKYRAEAIGFVPAMDLSDVGGVDLVNDQWVKIIGPIVNGKVEGVAFDQSLCGMCVAAKYRVPGTPQATQDNQYAQIMGDYIEGKTELGEMLATLQERWDRAYDVPDSVRNP